MSVKRHLPTLRIASREILPGSKILGVFLLVHVLFSCQVCVDVAPVMEAIPQLVLLVTSGKISHESRVGGWSFSHQQEASSTTTLSHGLMVEESDMVSILTQIRSPSHNSSVQRTGTLHVWLDSLPY